MEELSWMSGYEIANLIRKRSVKPSEVMSAVLSQVEHWEPLINSFVTVVAEEAMDAALAADSRLMRDADSGLPLLFGLPLSVKDLAPTAGIRTTFGSKAFADHVPDEDAISVRRLREAGAIVFGKTTTPEFGMLGVTESELTGVTANPWNSFRTAGGSSGGAAASIAAGIGSLAWGSDGGGSVRIPASFCGVLGMKPSMKWIPGDQPWDTAVTDGPITRAVVDQAMLLQATVGHHPLSPHSSPITGRNLVQRVLSSRPDLSGTRIAFAPNPAGARVSRGVAAVTGAAVQAMAEAGAEIVEVDLPLPDPIEYFIDFWGPYFLDPEAGLPHPAMRAIRDSATRVDLHRYIKTINETRSELTRIYHEVFANYDFLITPTSPVTAFDHPGDIGGNTDIDGHSVSFPAIDFHRFTESPSHAGIPAITVPAGFDEDDMPVGIQLQAAQHRDGQLLAFAAQWEQIQPWAERRPRRQS